MTPAKQSPPDAAETAMQPSYALFIKMSATEARPFIRLLFKLIQHFIAAFDLRGMTNKTGYRLQHETSVCDFVYSYDSRNGGFMVQTQFKPGASNELAGRVLTLIGVIVRYHTATGAPLQLDMQRSNLHDMKTLNKWGDWGVKQLWKKSPKDFPELAHLDKKAVKF